MDILRLLTLNENQAKNMQTRKEFIKRISVGTLGVMGAPGILKAGGTAVETMRRKPLSVNNNIQLALIGAGGMGVEDTNTALRHEGVKLVAVCDLYDGYLERAREKWGNDLFFTKDYREVLARNDVDAVIVATPDHWHKDISVAAMKAGKHVYC